MEIKTQLFGSQYANTVLINGNIEIDYENKYELTSY